MQIGAVVMASGDSARFGARDKLTAPFAGVPLICRTLVKLPRECFNKRLVVTRSQRVSELARAFEFDALLHALPDVSDTIRLGVQEMLDMDGCLFCVADQPFLSLKTVQALVASFARAPQRIYRAAYQGKVGNPVLFPRFLFHELSSLAPGQTGGAVITRHRELLSPVEATCALELADVDTEDDFQKYQRECEKNAADR